MTPTELGAGAGPARDPVEELAEDFLERFRRGERPALAEFIARAPDHADEIRELFPALVLLEKAGPSRSSDQALADPGVALERLGDYRIIREIGRGGMGIVYEAEQEALGRRVALKVLPAGAATDGQGLLRFRREARSAARLHHTNIVPVFDIGERDGVHYYAMQFIQGHSLDEVISELRRLRGEPTLATAPLVSDGSVTATLQSVTGTMQHESDFSTKSNFHFCRSVARIGVQAAGALAYAHSQRVLHRDVKPANLLLDAQGTIWVTDFGLAKEEGDDVTRTGDVVGTLRYMAPERLSGQADPRSDIYSLGLTLYELLTLEPAFPESDRARLVHAIARKEPPPPRSRQPDVPRDLETIILKAIAKEPGGRYATASDLEEDLRRFLADRPIRARRVSAWERTRRWCRRNPGWAATIAAVAGLLLIMAVGGGLLSLHLQQALTDLQAADEAKTEKLWQAHLERARGIRSSNRVGQRFEALKSIREAAKIKITPELRDEAVAALIHPDVELAREWEGWPDDTRNFAYDAAFERYARMNKKGEITLCRLTSAGEEIVGRLPAHGKPPYSGFWMSPDGRFLAFGHSSPQTSVAGAVRVWQLDGETPAIFLDEPAGTQFGALSFHPDGRRLAIGHRDGTISVYDLQVKDASPKRFTINQAANILAFHPRDGRLAAACGSAIRLFDTDAGKELPPLRHAKINSWLHGLAWHPEGRLLAANAVESTKIHIWDVETAREAMTPFEGHTAGGIFMTFNHAGDRLLSSGWDGHSRLWDVATGRLLLNMPGVYGYQFSPDDSQIGFERKGTKLRLWRLADGRELRTIRRPSADRSEIIASPVLDTHERVLAASSDKGLTFFEFSSGKELAFVPFTNANSCYPRRFHQDGLLTCGHFGGLLWPTRRDRSPGPLHVGPPRRLAFAVDIAADASTDGRIRIFPQSQYGLILDRDRPGWQMELGPQFDIRYCAVSPDGRLAATCSWFEDIRAKSIRIWEAKTGKWVTDLPLEDFHASAAFSPDGRWLASQTSGGAQLWEVGSWRPGIKLARFGCWSVDGRLCAATGVPSVIQLVDPSSGKELVRLTGPEATIYIPACMTADGTQLVAGISDSKSLYIWDLNLIRKHLRALDMDWELPEFAPTERLKEPDLAIQVDPGFLRRPIIEDDGQAVAAFSVLLALQPINPEACFQRGLAHEQRNESGKAVADYEAFLALAPAADHRRPEVYLRLAKLHFDKLRNHAGAAAVLLELEKLPADRIPWPEEFSTECNDVAWEFVKKSGDAKLSAAAEPLVRKALELRPHSFFFRNTLGAVLYRVGKYEEAAACLEKNLEQSGKYAAFDRYFLAMSYGRLGQKDKALDHFERANAAVKSETRLAAGYRQELAVFRAEAEAVLGTPRSP